MFHEGIVPDGAYHVLATDIACSDLNGSSSFSDALEIATAIWADTIRDLSTNPRGAPDGVVNIVDVLGVVGRFGSEVGSIVKARTDFEPDCLDLIINISDVLKAVARFQGLPYPYEPSAADPCDSKCGNPLP